MRTALLLLLPLVLASLGSLAHVEPPARPSSLPAAPRAAAASSAVPAPPRPAPGDGLALHAVASGGTTRWYRVHVPAGVAPDAPLPVVLAFHGGGGSASQLAAHTGLAATADAHGFLAVFPEGTGPLGGWPLFALQTWNAGGCCGSAAADGVDDVGFVRDLLDDLATRYPVDPARVFATGLSNGGMLAYRLALELPHRLAAVAPVAASLPVAGGPPPGLAAPAPIPVCAIHGLLDRLVPLEGGVGLGPTGFDHPSQRASLAPFVLASEALLPAGPTLVQGDALRFDLPAPTTGAPLRYWLLLDGGHTWPGAPAPGWNPDEPSTDDLDANEAVWAFFAEVAPPR